MEILQFAFWRTLDIGSWYAGHALAVDAVVYLVLFTGIARLALSRMFTDRGLRAVTAAVGIALTVGASTAAHGSGFTLGSLGPLAWLVLALVLILVVTDLLRRLFSALLSPGVPAPVLPTLGQIPGQRSVIRLTADLRSMLHARPPDARSEHVLMAIVARRKELDRRYQESLRLLASRGWRADPSKRRLVEPVRILLRAARENGHAFDDALRVVQAAHDTGNARLAAEAVDRLITIAAEADSIAAQLRRLEDRLRSDGVAGVTDGRSVSA